MTVIDPEARERRRKDMEAATERLKDSGALDELFAKIDAGEVQLEGHDGLIQQLIKAGLERGLQAELTDHLVYERGDPEAGLLPNSRNGSYPKLWPLRSAMSIWRSPETATARSHRHW